MRRVVSRVKTIIGQNFNQQAKKFTISGSPNIRNECSDLITPNRQRFIVPSNCLKQDTSFKLSTRSLNHSIRYCIVSALQRLYYWQTTLKSRSNVLREMDVIKNRFQKSHVSRAKRIHNKSANAETGKKRVGKETRTLWTPDFCTRA